MNAFWEQVIKAVSVYFSSMVKFIFGPMFGYAAGLNLTTSILITVAGTMTVVVAFTYFGEYLKKKGFEKFFSLKRFLNKYPKMALVWSKYGLTGISFLMPLILTPIGGTLIAISFGAPREKIILYMFISGSIWSVILNLAFYLGGKWVISLLS